ncbi:MAG: two-component regulator propeller domain-containing protein [Ferruginibacter sp.]
MKWNIPKRYILIVWLLANSFFGVSQTQHVQFEHIGTAMGLSQSNVISIFQDSHGFMWFGTRDGLNKYDGYKFTVYKYDAANENSLSHNTIQSIAEDIDGNLWLGTWGGGLNKFDWKKEKITHYRNDINNSNTISRDYITKILLDSKGNLWIGTEGGGLNLFDKKNNRFIHFVNNKDDQASLSDNRVSDIIEDASHNLWVATSEGGLNIFDTRSKIFRRLQHDKGDPASLSSNNCLALFIDGKNNMWVGTRGGGLNLYNKEKNSFIHFRPNENNSNSIPSNDIRAINEDPGGNLWIGTENLGLSIFNYRTGIFSNYLQDDANNNSLNNNTIYSIFRDDKGDMWTGTFTGGINMVSADANKFAHFRHNSNKNSLNNNTVLAIFEDSKENLWIGTDGGGVNLFNKTKGDFTAYKNNQRNTNSLCGNNVLSIFEDSYKDLWIGTWGKGVSVFNKDKNTYRHFNYDPANPKGLSSPNVWNISEDADKNIWLGTYGGGLCRYDRKSETFIRYVNDTAGATSLGGNFINIIYSDKKGNLWVGTNGAGLKRLNKDKKSFTTFSKKGGKNSISNDDIYCITEDLEGNLWFGTGLGLNRLDANTGQIKKYYIKDGLPNNTVTGLLFDKKESMWISTFNGLCRFNMRTGVFKTFDTNDGLQSNEFKMNSCFLSRSGKMYFGGINGFNEFFPDSIRENNYEPPLVFTDFQIFNKQVPIGTGGNSQDLAQSITATKELVLDYGQAVISFEFASLNYVFQNRKQYSYMLEGFDKDWNYIGVKHSATYTNLNPATYLFKVRALDNEGNWSKNMATIRLTITPPYWMTWWFRLAVLIGIIGAAIAYYSFRVRTIQAQKAMLQQQVYLQTSQLLLSTAEEHKSRKAAEQANRGLKAKNKELEQFVYVASHDLQEPLRTTAGFVDLLKQKYHGKLDEKADKYLNFISDATGRMRVLITDLLDFSRLGEKVELKRIDCNEMLRHMLADIMSAVQEAQAEIHYGDLPIIIGYPTEIKLLFQNLVINALKFRRKDITPLIKISASKIPGGWEFAVGDNGIGIEEKNTEKIFDIFQRLNTRTEYEGSGIGLSHCKKIVELHNGKIWVQSIPGEGSTFYFSLPQTEQG